MNKYTVSRGRILIISAVAALAPLAGASAGSNPETGAFYDFGRTQDTKVQGAAGPIRSDEPANRWQAVNPELGAFYRASDFGGGSQAIARGMAGPIRTDDLVETPAVASLAANPEAGSFYHFSTTW